MKWPASPNISGIAAALAGAVPAFLVSRATGAGWLPALGLALLLAVALYVFACDTTKGWGDLAEGVMVSVLVAIALMAVQRDAEEHTRETTERRDSQLRAADARRERQLREAEATRQDAAERESLQLALTLQSDLRGIALGGREMAGFFLARRNLADADLRKANLRGADLRGARFRGANMVGAILDDATLRGADLRRAVLSPNDPGVAASMRRADLEGADLRVSSVAGVDFTDAMLARADLRRVLTVAPPRTSFRGSYLIFADLAGADLGAADLRGARLGGARFCSVRGLKSARLEGAIYDELTQWPSGFDPAAHGAAKVRGGRARSFAFRGATGGYGGVFFPERCGS